MASNEPVIQMSKEQLLQMIEAIKGASFAGASSKAKGNFSNCSYRFWGDRDHNVVEEFITSVITYKSVEEISDEDALKGISLLFGGLASTWWQGVRKEATSWDQAIEMIRTHFSPTKPAYQVYQEIFEKKQNDSTPIDVFICDQRALLAQLPDNRHNEETELDFLYGLLHLKYRKKIPRDEFKTFKELLDKCRLLELTIEEKPQDPEGHSSKSNPKRCTYCNYRGHNYDNCRKRKQEEKTE